MNNDLKDLIDSIDSANKAHSDLETMIKYLKEEVQRLNFTVNEQKQIIQEQSIKLNKRDNSHLPQDIVLLKDLVLTQRQDIMKKDKDIEILQQTIEDLSLDLEKAENFDEDNEELIYDKKTIVQLTEENENLKVKIKDIEDKFNQFQKVSKLETQEVKDEDQDLIDAKKLIFQLTEETGINKVKIESLRLQNEDLKAKIQEQEDSQGRLNKELEESEKLIDQLTYDNDHLHEKINYLQKKLEETINDNSHQKPISEYEIDPEAIQKELRKAEEEILELKNVINSNINIIENLHNQNLNLEGKMQKDLETSEQKYNEYANKISEKEKELEQFNLRYKKIQNANKQLSDLIVELRMIEDNPPKETNYIKTIKRDYIDNLPLSLFFKMYYQLDAASKNLVVEQLIKDLENEKRDLRVYAIKILSIIKGKKILNALIKLKDETDWIIKLYLIKALNRFESSEIVDTLRFLQRDKDKDVREAANDILLKLQQN